ncbi:MAG TPA: phosphoribosyltransferase family protein [Candidatus Kapabacteria bacterium]|jgi:ComF family protein|nr:phosphoribosyltransferase family protein [Candidatus Kapabacteria bacterium]
MIQNLQNIIVDSLLELIAPKHCCLCSDKLYNEVDRKNSYCQSCIENLPEAPNSDFVRERLLQSITADDIAISEIIGLTVYSHELPIHNAIFDFKYHGISKIAYTLGGVLGNKITEYSLHSDFIIPVPIHPAKKRERGYNQAEEIAKGICSVVNIPLIPFALKRTFYTASQTTTTSSAARWENVANIFNVDGTKSLYHDKNVLLVDDVFTTGATTNNCASLLLQHGAKRVDVAVIGITEKQ